MLKLILILLISFSTEVQAQSGTRNHASPSASELLNSLAEHAKSVRLVLYNIIDGNSTAIPVADITSGNIKIDIQSITTSVPRKIAITVNPNSGSGDVLDSNSANVLAAKVRAINGIAYPASAATMTTVADWRAAAEVQNIANEVNAVLAYCDEKITSTTREFWFEVVPLHLYCHALNRQNLVSYRQQINMEGAATSDAVIMPPDDFNWVKNHILAELAAGAVIHHSHTKIANTASFVKNKARCFPVGRPMVETVLASAGMTFNQPSSNASTVALSRVEELRLPEPNYALGAADQYYNDEKNLVFNNYPPGLTATTAPSFQIDNQSYRNFQFDSQGVLHFKFRVRDIHRSTSPSTCQWFCQNLENIKSKKTDKHPS